MCLNTCKILDIISKLNFVVYGVKFGVLELICTYEGGQRGGGGFFIKISSKSTF